MTRYPFARMDALFDWLRAGFLTVVRLAVVALLLLAVTGVCGCGDLTPPERAQAALTTGADVVVAFDAEAAERLTAATEEALREASSLAEWQGRTQPWKRLTIALSATKAALLTAQAAVNVWKATGDDASFRSVAGCLAAQLELLYDAARSVDLNDRLASLDTVVRLAAAYTDGLCPEGER